jgi:transposase
MFYSIKILFMQEEKLSLKGLRVGSLPILDRFIERMGLRAELSLVITHAGYVDALLVLLKNILVDRNALYAIAEWAAAFDPVLVAGGKVGDDRLGRALDHLFSADRATLQTRIVLAVAKAFQLRFDRIHSDTTSVAVFGAYTDQDAKAVALKRGHSKDHRPDLKQLVYNLCISSDGAVPVHFKAYDGNQTDDGIQWETWSSLRSLLQCPDFIYVADSKLCTQETLRKIDREHGRFVTMVPRTRSEVGEFTEEILSGEVRWERIWRKRSSRKGSEFDTFECVVGHYQLREGFCLFWYRSSQKKRRDQEDRKNRIARAWEKMENLDLRRGRGPKTERALRKRIEKILLRCGVQDWLRVDVKFDAQEHFKALTRGKPTVETRYRRFIKKIPRLHIQKNAEAIARSKAMDGIFPLATNTKEKALEVLKIYKYQPKLEKRHALLKSTLEVAPIWIKKNTRIEALMFIEYLAQMVAALIERELRTRMQENKITLLESLPEHRASQTPTIEQVLRIFEHRSRHELYENGVRLKSFADPMTSVQTQILSLLQVPHAAYGPA